MSDKNKTPDEYLAGFKAGVADTHYEWDTQRTLYKAVVRENEYLKAMTLEVLRAVEWSDSNITANSCPECRILKFFGHHEECKLAVLIKELE